MTGWRRSLMSGGEAWACSLQASRLRCRMELYVAALFARVLVHAVVRTSEEPVRQSNRRGAPRKEGAGIKGQAIFGQEVLVKDNDPCQVAVVLCELAVQARSHRCITTRTQVDDEISMESWNDIVRVVEQNRRPMRIC
jgi:hypothetical protein